jgi:hypothetical protein
MIDLMAISAIDRDTEITYVRRERDWLARARSDGRDVPSTRLLPMLPTGAGNGAGNGAAAGDGHGHGHGAGGHGHA